MKPIYLTTLFFAALLSGLSFAAKKAKKVVEEVTGVNYKVKSGKVSWTAVGNPGFLKIDGKGGVPTGSAKLAGGVLTGSFEVQLKAYKTGIDLRDTHMKEKYLEVDKYPRAVLDVIVDGYVEGKEITWKGILELKGVKKPAAGTVNVVGKTVKASFKVNLEDYPSIGVPSYLGVTVAKEVDVAVEMELE